MEEYLNTFLSIVNKVVKFTLTYLSVEMIIYIAIALLVLILVMLISKSIKRHKADRRISDLEVEMNEIRNNTLSFKYNKASAFARSNNEVLEKVRDIKPKYESCMESIQRCEELFGEADDKVASRKIKKANRAMDELEEIIDGTKEKVTIINQALDLLLVREKEVREDSNAIKNRFANVKTVYQNNRLSFYDAALYFDAIMLELENDFSGFEEWMFASEFDKAKEELDKMSNRIEQTSSRIAAYPGLYEKSKIILPKALTEVQNNVLALKGSNIDIDFTNADTGIEKVQTQLKEVVEQLDKGNEEGISDTLTAIGDDILSIQDELDREKQAYDEIHGNWESNLGMIDAVEDELKEIESLYTKIKDRFGLEDWTAKFAHADAHIEELKDQRDAIQAGLESADTLNSDIIHDYRLFADEVKQFSSEIHTMKQKLVGASSDESRAQKQIVKLQLILNEVRLNAATKKLPSVSSQFDEDIEEGARLIKRVQTVLDHSPLDVPMLNADLQIAIDHVYKLYNNTNNLIGIAVMVENAIVFGNRFRSGYPEMDSDLTRAELCFQNGEYTKALKLAIRAIENMHPGIYEKLVARKDPAVMNMAQ